MSDRLADRIVGAVEHGLTVEFRPLPHDRGCMRPGGRGAMVSIGDGAEHVDEIIYFEDMERMKYPLDVALRWAFGRCVTKWQESEGRKVFNV